MSSPNEKSNPFLPVEKSLKTDASNIFSESSKPIFPRTTQSSETFTSDFASESSTSQKQFSSNQADSYPLEKDPRKLFGLHKHATATTSSTFKTSNIFGGKPSTTDPSESSWGSSVFDLTKDPSKITARPSSKEATESKDISLSGSDTKSATGTAFSIQKSSGFAIPPVPVFTSHVKPKDSKPNIFGGNQVFKKSSDSTSSIQSSSHPSTKFSIEDKKSPSIPKPALVFSSKFDRKDSYKQISHSSKFAESSSQSEDSKHSNQDASRSVNVFKNVPKKQSVEEDYNLFGSVAQDSPSEVATPPMEPTTLVAVEVPENYLEKSILKNHFEKFGYVKKILINKKSNQASIYFEDHKAAAEAKAKGKKLHPKLPEMKLFFGAQPAAVRKRTDPIKRVTSNIGIPVEDFPSASTTATGQSSTSSSGSSVKSQIVEKSKGPSQTKRTDFRNKAPSGNIGSIKDFSVLAKFQAKNNYDKFLILDARDKDIRSKQKKVVDVTKAHYLLATCPDMCPEKERYSRDIQYDISIYEMTNNKMDPKRVVKKFSRSSADKDEPLPHELRPGPVLKMTMDFLTCNIIEKGDEAAVQIDLWYNYLCNRTRALRNDIMQQHLLDSNAVYVLERCTRFHIHCSHHLCEEPADYFDVKINNEHLAKSLQSLKELYHDLEEKGICFETESEFRAYEILLNVNDGNVIFKYLQFRKPVRNSDNVQFAVKVLHSINANNYVQFFKLLKKATYLEACIMHKYFTSVRMKALNAIVKAYSSQTLPSEKVMNMLGFSNEAKFQSYVEQFGIDIGEDSKVTLNKAKFIPKPDPLPIISKSIDIILVKKNSSIGRVVQNGELPKNPLSSYIPHNSFNSMGKLNDAAINASDQGSVMNQSPDRVSKQEGERKKEKHREDMENKKLQMELRSKVDEMLKLKLVSRYFRIWQAFVQLRLEEKRLKAETRLKLVKKIANIWRKKAVKSAELEKRVENHLKSKFFKRWQMYINEIKENKDFVQKAKLIEEKILIKRYCNIWKRNSAYKKSVKEAKVARTYLLSVKYLRIWRLQAANSVAERKSDLFYRAMLLKSYFMQWKLWCSMFRNKNRFNFESFPAIGCQMSVEEQNNLLDWGYDRNDSLNMSAYEISQMNKDICIKSRKHFSLQQLSGIVAWTALPLVQRFEADVNSQPPDFSRNVLAKCFKFLLLVEPETDSYLLEWVRTKFNILEVEDLSSPLQYQTCFTSRNNGVTYSVIVSEKKFPSPWNVDLDGASLVILVSNANKLGRLSEFAANLGQVPYLIMCKSEAEDVSENVWRLTKESVDDPLISEKLFNLVFRLWQSRSRNVNLRKGKCCEIVSEFISKEVLTPVYHTVSQRKLFGKLMICPTKVVEFYNAAISHAQMSFGRSKILACDWPPSEALSLLGGRAKLWNKSDSDIIAAALQKALLPAFSVQPSTSWRSITEHLAIYLKDVISWDTWGGNLYSEIQKILRTYREHTAEDESCEDSYAIFHDIPWVDILNACIFFKLSLLPDIDVGYMQSDLFAFSRNEKWISAVRNSRVASIKRKKDASTKRKGTLGLELEPKKQKKEASPSKLLMDIKKEKEKFLQYEEELSSMLLIDEELKLLYEKYDDALSS